MQAYENKIRQIKFLFIFLNRGFNKNETAIASHQSTD